MVHRLLQRSCVKKSPINFVQQSPSFDNQGPCSKISLLGSNISKMISFLQNFKEKSYLHLWDHQFNSHGCLNDWENKTCQLFMQVSYTKSTITPTNKFNNNMYQIQPPWRWRQHVPLKHHTETSYPIECQNQENHHLSNMCHESLNKASLVNAYSPFVIPSCDALNICGWVTRYPQCFVYIYVGSTEWNCGFIA
jgi:hypothetical protein